jgi:hypothetical protein
MVQQGQFEDIIAVRNCLEERRSKCLQTSVIGFSKSEECVTINEQYIHVLVAFVFLSEVGTLLLSPKT